MAKQKDTHWWDVKAALGKKGISLSEVALRHGVSTAAIAKIKRVPNARLQSAIAEVLGAAPQDIWPSRYYVSSGRPVRPSTWLRKNNRTMRRAHVKKSEAA
ncbi:helix-turn-helix domain-containing protein [Varunaivibrio sulfuroxidans]|uniref:Nlp family transcriptional regulator n=1 Tax=Varunaivibrio sulfuroxidans TaxID=1773489 RepID=A0A4R3JBV6_9PROT|nr:helix-turn-helix domain-containing protein [Varunaivibrio sulfuroxidans]TCS62553.1 Nlp family transcriptional regulator [Varunaivibrio sulfuroxidans]WES30777.1 helix-turn-helix domain-containing protein [Varunaivibrio sulfuroxidans]